MKQKLFSIFFVLAMSLPVSVLANVNVTITVNGSTGGSVSYTYKTSRNSSNSTSSTTSTATVSQYVGSKNAYSVSLTATQTDGYQFTRWESNGTLSSTTNTTTSLTIPAGTSTNYTVTAYFTATATDPGTITGLSNNNAYGTVSVSHSGQQAAGTQVTLTATPKDGYAFSQWNDGNTDNPRTVTVNGDAKYTATFVEHIYRTDAFYYTDANTSIGNMSPNSGDYVVWRVHVGRNSETYFKSSIHIDFLLYNVTNAEHGVHNYGTGYTAAPEPGAYTNGVSTLNKSNAQAGSWLVNATYSGNSRWAAYYLDDGTCLDIESGLIVVAHGTNNTPFIQIVNATLSDGSTLNCTIGEPSLTLNWNWSWDDVLNTNSLSSGATTTSYAMGWKDADENYVTLVSTIYTANAVTANGQTFLPNGVYPVSRSAGLGNIAGGDGTYLSGTTYRSQSTIGTNTQIYINGGAVIVKDGANGLPYVTMLFGVDFSSSQTRYSAFFSVGSPKSAVTSYTLDWDANGGSINTAGTAAGEYEEGASLTAPTVTNTGYEFVKWRDVTNGVDFSGSMPANDVTYTAQWTQTVTLNQNSATTNGTASVTATYNGTIGSIANNPSKTGYDFGGWCDASGSLIINTSGELQSNVTNWTSATGKWIHAGTSTLYAKWTQVVTLDKNGGSENGTVTVTYNANTTASFSAVTGLPEGYSALKGYYDAATGGNKIFNADGSLVTGSAVAGLIDASGNWIHTGAAPSIYAQFTPNTNTNYTVKHWQQNLADNDYTEVTGDRQQLQGTTDDATAADANTYTGFTAQSFDQETIAGDGSTVVNIYYNRDTYTVNLAVSPAGYGSVSPSAAITGVRYGTVITTGTGENANKVTINKTVVTANPAATTAEYTYTFDNWINGTATVTGSGLT
ncbi:MAG: InlB B-repeat-containing protein, partial [Paludibacteraceae bacterium]|nr:InlB B-repeat-containing protein [Paludibacteraceae bacterium]